MNKIALGSAQFGLDYGINNKKGKIPHDEVFAILALAVDSGIDTVDTAYAYGESEKVLGNFMATCSSTLKIISKLPQCEYKEIDGILKASLGYLCIDSLYGYLVHDFASYKKERQIWDKLREFKRNGQIEKIGFSVYYPSELELLLRDNLDIDIIQVPYSIFDQRFEPYFAEIAARNIEIYVRSVFLQGIVFKKIEDLSNYFKDLKTRLTQLHLLARDSGVPVFALCLNFATRNIYVHKVVVGVDNLANFRELIRATEYLDATEKLFLQLHALRISDEKIIVPVNWEIEEARI